MPECIGVKFDNGPKIHYMEAPPSAPAVGTRCVVSTRRGLELGRVRTEPRDVAKPHGHYVRDALDDDLQRHQELLSRADDLKWLLRARARQSGADVKIVAVEFTMDEELMVVSYSAEDHPPLRVLAQELIQHTRARIEFSNVGPRDQARMLGTLGDQQLPLTPEKISGPCGRLMCCLQYEHDMYKELLKGMPKKGGRACHDESGTCGRIVKLNPLKGTVDLRTEEGAVEEYPASEVSRTRA
ncbi:MAG: PSP1 C-terminal domain-containing protein [Deinococcales bacterium]